MRLFRQGLALLSLLAAVAILVGASQPLTAPNTHPMTLSAGITSVQSQLARNAPASIRSWVSNAALQFSGPGRYSQASEDRLRAAIGTKLAGCPTCDPSGADGIMLLIIVESLKASDANQALQGLSSQQQQELRKRLADLQKQAEELANELKNKNASSFFHGMANYFTGNDNGVGKATPIPAARPFVLPSH